MLIDVDQAVEFLLSGEAIAVPTETVYGLAAIATNPEAIARIFEIKNRPADNPLICHFHSVEQITSYVTSISENSLILLHHFSPGPLSFMFEIPEDSPLKFATCGNKQVIARIPDHQLLLSIIKKSGAPLAAPSANTSGKVSPTSAEMVSKDLGEKIAGIVDGGIAAIGLESTILDARSKNEIIVLRPGAIGEKEIKSILPDIRVRMDYGGGIKNIPGSKYRHYSPNTPIGILHSADEIIDHPGTGIFLSQEAMQSIPENTLNSFTTAGIQLLSIGSLSDLNVLAKDFYKILSSIDQLTVSDAFFIVPDFGNSSLGNALQNRVDKILIK